MTSFPILDLVLGMIFVYFLLSIICSSVVEMFLTTRKIRARVLEQWLTQIFSNQVTNKRGVQVRLGEEIMNHCTVTALSQEGKAPSYISAENFVAALLEKIISNTPGATMPASIDEIIKLLENTTALPDDLKKAFLLYANEAKDTVNSLTQKTIGAIESFRLKIEKWYDTNMDRISGTLKVKYTRPVTLIASIVICILLNADTISIARYLYSNPDARAKVAEKAYQTGTDKKIEADMSQLNQSLKGNDTAKYHTATELQNDLNAKVSEINEAKATLDDSIPLGWNQAVCSLKWYQWILKAVGMAITVLAIMMGAPFWFDILNKVANIRGSGAKPAPVTQTDKSK